MTNHKPFEEESYIQRIGKKKKAFKIKSWKDKYKRLREIEEKKK